MDAFVELLSNDSKACHYANLCAIRRIMSGVLCGRSITEGKDLIGRLSPFEPPGQNGELAKYAR